MMISSPSRNNAAGALALLLLAGFAASASAAPAQSSAPAKLPDWYGVWQVQPEDHNFNFDPSVPKGEREHPPLTPEYEKIYQANIDSIAAGKPLAGLGGSCVPNGMPRIMRAPLPREFVPTPRIVYILNEDRREIRRIYTDGRGHPSDLDPSYEGHSIGHWEGNTLVADTVGIKTGVFDQNGLPHSDAIHIVERIRRLDKDMMEDQFTITDAKAFTGPWVVTRQYKLKPDWNIQEDTCDENNRDITDANGNYVGTKLTPAD